jgi:hypothetical protein
LSYSGECCSPGFHPVTADRPLTDPEGVDLSVAAALEAVDQSLSADSRSGTRALRAGREIRPMLDEGCGPAAPGGIDLCMILGAGWSFHLGGITLYLKRAGH